MRLSRSRFRLLNADMALLFLGSWFDKLLRAPSVTKPPRCTRGVHHSGRTPKSLLGLVITALAEKWLRRQLWIPPSNQGVRVVIDAVLRSCRGMEREAGVGGGQRQERSF
jgi:hypothetical protein